MANIREIKGRIKSAKNIAKITKAMELVAASKMRKAQDKALAGKLYASKIYDMVMQLSSQVDFQNHPLLRRQTELTGRRLIVVISTNKGLCGGLNTNLFRHMLESYHDGRNIYVTLGKKAVSFVVRSREDVFADFSETISFSSIVSALTELVSDEFVTGRVDSVDLCYSEFQSVVKQEPNVKTILPLTLEAPQLGEDSDNSRQSRGYVIEPDAQRVFDQLLPHYLENQIRDAVLQAEASEHSARMVAMRNATDNATSFITDLTLVYNKARQEKITYELGDLTTARLALRGE